MSTSNVSTCPHCGGMHSMPCPAVRAIEYFPNGTIKRVEYRHGYQPMQPIIQTPHVVPATPTKMEVSC